MRTSLGQLSGAYNPRIGEQQKKKKTFANKYPLMPDRTFIASRTLCIYIIHQCLIITTAPKSPFGRNFFNARARKSSRWSQKELQRRERSWEKDTAASDESTIALYTFFYIIHIYCIYMLNCILTTGHAEMGYRCFWVQFSAAQV